VARFLGAVGAALWLLLWVGGGLRLRVKPAMTCGGGKRQCGARRAGKNVPQGVGG